ncbi:hypothetical protein FRB93_006103 [Tulasnella sp. JGI-2019a]|nr:hypothetical protein FRB93_006103 [Tulasnella sp. JGI-2019a]
MTSMTSDLELPKGGRIQTSAQTKESSQCEPKTMIQKQEDLLKRHPPPEHWRAPLESEPFGKLRRAIFNLLCITSHGHAGLDPLWANIRLEEEGDESVWVDGIRQTCDRLNNMVVVGSLLLATAAVFITTSPPEPSIINYTLRGPYICILGSFAMLIGGIIVTATCALVASKARPYWSEQVLYSNRFHVYCTLIMLSYPFFSIGLATLLLAFGVLSAVWCAEDLGVQIAAVAPLILPISMSVLFGISCTTAATKSRLRQDWFETPNRADRLRRRDSVL